jgi:hypothetical protein
VLETLSAAALMPLPKPAGIAEADFGAANAIAAPAKVINKNLRMRSPPIPPPKIKEAPKPLNRT